jgi:2-dehydropantoate 2-reductase
MRERHTGGMTTYAVIGVGGVGGYYGTNLAASGADVHFLIRGAASPGDRLELSSPDGDITLRPGRDCQVHRDWSTVPPVDIAVVAVKATANAEVAGRLGPIVRPGGAVVLIQNGIDEEPRFATALGSEVEVIGGLAFLASYRRSATRFVHIDYGTLTVAAFRPGYARAAPTAAMTALAQDLGRRGIPVVLTEDLLQARWQKLAWNLPFNGLSVVLDATTDALMAHEPIQGLIAELMGEVQAAAAGDGRPLGEDLPEQLLALTRRMRPYASSMKLDFDARRPLEVDALPCGDPPGGRRGGGAAADPDAGGPAGVPRPAQPGLISRR